MTTAHRRVNVLALALLVAAAAGTAWAVWRTGSGRADAVVHGSTSARAADPAGHTPVRLDIARARVHARVLDLGLNDDGSLQTPGAEEGRRWAGWYDRSAAPGDPGTAVMVGHHDTGSGRGVFHDLGDLRPADTVVVTRRDGSRARFTVTRVVRVPGRSRPAEAWSTGAGGPSLRLITCTRGQGDSLIVDAAAVRSS
ncbi:sortase domain-bontaining protein [Streptomyces sp. MI02-7b]|uniref:sortase domain-containing protein n=1 Tax=Streptomyces sp. MI02-7b TaxID=462941 RepID=UPI0029B7F443|nr:sortase [Streptomyces sp. MI02-7b]MDX3074318.1 sortase [Streptomyces sp. MI02-7b]